MTEEELKKNIEEETKYEIINKTLTDPTWTAERAAEVLHLTVRQVFRLKAVVKAEGRAGLIHGNTGRKPVTTLPDRLHRRVVELYSKEYHKFDVNYSHFSDILADDYELTVNRETVRQWLRAAGLGHKAKRYSVHRRKRERRARMGELLFLDGSPHRWFGPEEPQVTLLLATDDATGAPLYGCFKPHENRNGCFEVFYHVARKWGLPYCFYLGRGSVFKTTRHGGDRVHQQSEDLTAFQTAMKRLGVWIIYAYSPQARGHGERMNGSFQGRLVAELRYHRITTLAEGTKYTNEHFIPRYVQHFAVAPRDPNPAFRPVPENRNLHRILCKESHRRVNSDNTIHLNGRTYQLHLPKSSPAFYGATVRVEEWFDDTVHIYHNMVGEIRNELLPIREIYRLMDNYVERRTMT
jgi:hypothetical protein